jgi:glycosyltransferase involved in cell wall biosynthesis
MRIAITGTRGIPNRYGGFERFAEKLSTGLSDAGHEVLVYNPHYHPSNRGVWSGVNIRVKRSYEKILGAGGNLFYDLICLRDAIRMDADIILECGYASAAPWYPVLNRKGTKLVTHMDGMEWQREKWGRWNRKTFRRAEWLAVKYSDAIVCDHPRIADYYLERYSVRPDMIPFGADIRKDWDVAILADPGVSGNLGFNPGSYYLLVARMEPENNLRMVIEGYLASGSLVFLVIIGDYSGKYGQALVKEFGSHERIRFIGGLYNEDLLDHLRHFSKAVFHGHSVGGTNPSLLEAMAAGALVIAHDNAYNRWVLGGNAAYFNSSAQISEILSGINEMEHSQGEMIRANLERIRTEFQWDSVILQYSKLFEKLVSKGN